MRSFVAVVVLALTLTIAGQAFAVDHTYTVINDGLMAWKIDTVDNPTLNLVKGHSYAFNVNAVGHQFYIKTVQIIGSGGAYNNGVTNNGAATGTVTWAVPSNAPDVLYYQCGIHEAMTGEIDLATPAPGVTPWSAATLVVVLGLVGGAVMMRRRRSLAS